MMISSELTIAWCRLRGGAIGKCVSARPRRTCVSLFMITGQAPRSTHTSRHDTGLVGVLVVGDDRHDVVGLDRHADVDDQLGVLADRRDRASGIVHLTSWVWNAGSTSRAKRSTCPN